MTIIMLITLVVVFAVVLAARRNRPRVTHIERRIERKDGDDA